MSETFYLTKRDLRERGWSDRDIDQHLEPVAVAINPQRPKGHVMNLYDVNRVEELETQLEASWKYTQEALNNTRRWAEQLPVKVVQNLKLNQLREILGPDAGDRDLVSFIRHHYCNYEKQIARCDNRVGPDEAKYVLRLRVLRAITRTYPSLRMGCEAQWEKWYGKEDSSF